MKGRQGRPALLFFGADMSALNGVIVKVES